MIKRSTLLELPLLTRLRVKLPATAIGQHQVSLNTMLQKFLVIRQAAMLQQLLWLPAPATLPQS